MPTRDYYTSEQFIWDDLIEAALQLQKKVYDVWRDTRAVTDFLITWPSEVIKAQNGGMVSGPCGFSLVDIDPAIRHDSIIKVVGLTKAYALLLVERKENKVQIILESHHGARCWDIPIVRSGDVDVLGTANLKINTDHVGLLWKPTRSVSASN